MHATDGVLVFGGATGKDGVGRGGEGDGEVSFVFGFEVECREEIFTRASHVGAARKMRGMRFSTSLRRKESVATHLEVYLLLAAAQLSLLGTFKKISSASLGPTNLKGGR